VHQTSTVQSTAPARREAAKLVLAMLVFAVGSYFAFPPVVGLAALVLFGGLAALFLCGICFPSSFLRGLTVVPGGFEVWRPLRKALRIRYEEIEAIAAVAHGGGDTSDELTFQVTTRTRKVSVHEYDFYVTGVFGELAQLDGFNQTAFDAASHHDASFRDWLIGKKFLLYVRGARTDA
jgi:hypothetical protein